MPADTSEAVTCGRSLERDDAALCGESRIINPMTPTEAKTGTDMASGTPLARSAEAPLWLTAPPRNLSGVCASRSAGADARGGCIVVASRIFGDHEVVSP